MSQSDESEEEAGKFGNQQRDNLSKFTASTNALTAEKTTVERTKDNTDALKDSIDQIRKIVQGNQH